MQNAWLASGTIETSSTRSEATLTRWHFEQPWHSCRQLPPWEHCWIHQLHWLSTAASFAALTLSTEEDVLSLLITEKWRGPRWTTCRPLLSSASPGRLARLPRDGEDCITAAAASRELVRQDGGRMCRHLCHPRPPSWVDVQAGCHQLLDAGWAAQCRILWPAQTPAAAEGAGHASGAACKAASSAASNAGTQSMLASVPRRRAGNDPT